MRRVKEKLELKLFETSGAEARSWGEALSRSKVEEPAHYMLTLHATEGLRSARPEAGGRTSKLDSKWPNSNVGPPILLATVCSVLKTD